MLTPNANLLVAIDYRLIARGLAIFFGFIVTGDFDRLIVIFNVGELRALFLFLGLMECKRLDLVGERSWDDDSG